MRLIHWNYFIAVEKDLINLSRYIEFDKLNLSTFSIEIAQILMMATQEIDVLLKQICQRNGNGSDSEGGYRAFIPTKYPKIMDIEVQLPKHDLDFTPFHDWKNGTPSWWTANNKVKHQRHTHFKDASLENLLNSVSGLLIANLHYYDDILKPGDLFPGTQLLYPAGIVKNVTPTAFGMIPIYRLP